MHPILRFGTSIAICWAEKYCCDRELNLGKPLSRSCESDGRINAECKVCRDHDIQSLGAASLCESEAVD